MIIDLPATTSSAINRKMVDLREAGGANAQGRVLTLVIVNAEDDDLARPGVAADTDLGIESRFLGAGGAALGEHDHAHGVLARRRWRPRSPPPPRREG